MFGSHLKLLIVVFVFILGVIMTIAYLKAAYSPNRYEAQAILNYRPERTDHIPPENAQYVLQILSQSSLHKQFMDELDDEDDDRQKKVRPKIMVAAIERNKQVDHFDIRISSRDKAKVIKMTNAFSELCIKAYIEARTASLKEKERSLNEKNDEISGKLRKIDDKKNKLGVPLQNNTLDKEYEALRQKLSDLRLAQTKLAITIGGLEKNCNALQNKQIKLNPELIANEKFLQEQIAALKKLDQEILLSENMYTPQNPKMQALLSRREAIRERLSKFMAEKKIDANDIDHFAEIADQASALKEAQKELSDQRAKMRALEEEIKESEENFNRLRDAMPLLQELNREYASLQESQKKINIHLAEISTLMPRVQNDLRIVEPSHAALGLMPFGKKDIFTYVFSALSLTMLVAILTVLLEFLGGKVSGAQELSIIPEMRFLGTLPSSKELFGSKRKEQMAFSTICHNFQMSENEHHIVLTSTLPGGKLMSELFGAFEWSYAMEGKRTLEIDMVLADNFDYEEYPPVDTGIIVYSGGKGFLPVVSKHYLSPSEQMLLKQDLEILRNSYDLIFIKHAASLRNDRLFIDQIISMCDSALFVIGAKKTPRKMLRQLIDLQRKTALPIMTILSESSSSGKDDKPEEEE